MNKIITMMGQLSVMAMGSIAHAADCCKPGAKCCKPAASCCKK